MDRRAYLGRCVSFGIVAALAGCTDQSLEEMKNQPPWVDPRFHEEELDLPVTQKYGVTAEAIERAEGETFEEPPEIEEFLGEEGLPVEKLEETEKHGETVLELEYVIEELIDEGSAHTLGVVAGGYAALVRGGYDGDVLEATLLESDGSIYGEFEVRTEWAEEYNESEKSTAVYGGEVVDTLEST